MCKYVADTEIVAVKGFYISLTSEPPNPQRACLIAGCYQNIAAYTATSSFLFLPSTTTTGNTVTQQSRKKATFLPISA